MNIVLFIAQLIIITTIGTIPSIKDLGNEIYIGIDNQVIINLKNCNPELVDLKISSGTLIKRDDSTYSIIVQIPEDDLKVKLYYKKVICEIKMVKAVILPSPELTFETIGNGIISKKNAEQTGKLKLTYPSEYANIPLSSIISFNVTIQDPMGKPIFSNYIRGDALDKNTLNMLSKAKNGSKLFINNVITQSSNLGARSIPVQLALEIVD